MEPMSRLPSDPPLELGSEHRLDRLHVTLLVSVSMSKSSLSSRPVPQLYFNATIVDHAMDTLDSATVNFLRRESPVVSTIA